MTFTLNDFGMAGSIPGRPERAAGAISSVKLRPMPSNMSLSRKFPVGVRQKSSCGSVASEGVTCGTDNHPIRLGPHEPIWSGERMKITSAKPAPLPPTINGAGRFNGD